MRVKQTDHRDGSFSLRFYPETEDEKQNRTLIYSRYPGGTPHNDMKASFKIPVLSKDGTDWDQIAVGDRSSYFDLFARRIETWYPKEGK